MVTGKPVLIGGSVGREEATGRGVVITAVEALSYLQKYSRKSQFQNPTVVIQGFGNVGCEAAKIFHQKGFKVVAVSDSRGGIYNPHGLLPYKVERFKSETGSVVDYPEADPITNEDLLSLPCTVLVPAALENQITAENADKIQAKIVAEGANGPSTPAADADEILHKNGVFVIPDIIANAGGVTVSYFEWVQGREQEYWDKKTVNDKLEKKMKKAFAKVLSIQEQRSVNMCIAAYIHAVSRVVEAGKLRGS